jgi:hypothetical protein
MSFREVPSDITLDKPLTISDDSQINSNTSQRFKEVSPDIVLDEIEPFQFGGGGRPSSGATGSFDFNVEGLVKNFIEERGLGDIVNPPGFEPLRESMKNAPGSVYNFTSNILTTIADPLKSAETIGKLMRSVYKKFTPGVQPEEQLINGVGKFFSDRYGSINNLRETFKKDPAGLASDFSMAFNLAGKVANTLGASKVGPALVELGKSIEPIRALRKLAEPVTSAVGVGTKSLLG